ncbi:recombinase family protein [uncultured Litoreibacter sp.]|uniref:recombinase family protein n=1 Tax=uncultured Litoreibacter sp. TaxID=1392394 RepID=UPI002627566C|nr:recombinase family protein [uncultured Litoreibacter sp.]
MKPCFGYIRVSTQKQGEGASLEAQKDAITVFASRNELTITKWFEEKETAAKSGRPVFTGMLKLLKQGKAQGVIIHKIDRSARNLRDWAMFSELPDAGVSVFVATESLDFSSRGGRLTADIQAVIAADYIRNLREECIKGINGRLKQGLFPWGAPPGYLNQGGGKPKIPCPKTAPLIKLAFELYASRQYSYETLLDELHRRGLRNTRGGKLTLCGLGNVLQNPFYIGLMHIKSSGETYQGIHEPIVPVAVWKRVQAIRKERSGPKSTRHNHLFMGLFRCGLCDKPMVPERQKGHVYYRCKRRGCATKTIREELLHDAIRRELGTLELNAQAQVRAQNTDKPEALCDLEEQRSALELQIKDEKSRLGRIEDLLIDGTLSRDAYARKQGDIQLRLAELSDELLGLPDVEALAAYQQQLAELRKNLVFLYDMANRAEKRMIVENVWPNRIVSRNEVSLKPYSWVKRADFDPTLLGGVHEQHRDRSCQDITEDDKPAIKPLFAMLDRLCSDEAA